MNSNAEFIVGVGSVSISVLGVGAIALGLIPIAVMLLIAGLIFVAAVRVWSRRGTHTHLCSYHGLYEGKRNALCPWCDEEK